MKRTTFITVIFIFIVCFWLSTATLATDIPFSDVHSTDWFYQEVQYVYRSGLMKGTSTTTFEPNGNITRGMIVTILHRMEGTPKEIASCPFYDVGLQRYYREAIIWAYVNKIVNGYNQTMFDPDDVITRQQLATILYRYSEFKGYDISKRASLSGFTDNNQINAYASDSMAWANAEGLIHGTSAGALLPKGNATRAHAAAILARFCQNIANKAVHESRDAQSPAPLNVEDAPDATREDSEGKNDASNDSDNVTSANRSGSKMGSNAGSSSPASNGAEKNSGTQDDTTHVVGAEDANIFRVTANQASDGGTIELTVTLSGDVLLCGFDITLQYNRTLFSLKDLDAIHELDIVSYIDNENGRITFNYAGAKNITKPKLILTATFDIVGDAGRTGAFLLLPTEVVKINDRNDVEPAAYHLVNQTVTIIQGNRTGNESNGQEV